jgi:branched-subunit amino acid transport protein
MNELLLISGMAFVTYGIRVVLLPAASRMEFSPLLKRALHYVPAAVLTAIIAPAILMPSASGL